MRRGRCRFRRLRRPVDREGDRSGDVADPHPVERARAGVRPRRSGGPHPCVRAGVARGHRGRRAVLRSPCGAAGSLGRACASPGGAVDMGRVAVAAPPRGVGAERASAARCGSQDALVGPIRRSGVPSRRRRRASSGSRGLVRTPVVGIALLTWASQACFSRLFFPYSRIWSFPAWYVVGTAPPRLDYLSSATFSRDLHGSGRRAPARTASACSRSHSSSRRRDRSRARSVSLASSISPIRGGRGTARAVRAWRAGELFHADEEHALGRLNEHGAGRVIRGGRGRSCARSGSRRRSGSRQRRAARP